MPKISKVIGPPGTGKTTYLLRQIQRAAKKFYVDRIGAVSFTKAAVEEMASRVTDTAGVDRKLAKNIRTVHSLCFELLNMSTDRVAEKLVPDFNKRFPQFAFRPNYKSIQDDVLEYHDEQNLELYRQMQVYRNRLVPMGQWPRDVAAFFNAWHDGWCLKEGLMDFTAMIENAIRGKFRPEIDVLFVDECQDLTPLQLSLLDAWSKETQSTIYVGDSDQAIYRFSGAVPEAFRDLKHDWQTVLSQSYRVPLKVHALAQKIIQGIRDREDVKYEPRTNGDGSADYAGTPDLSLEGSHMILVRCNYQIGRWKRFLLAQKRMWHNPYRLEDLGWNPIRTGMYKAIMTYFRLQRTTISLPELKTMVKEVKSAGNLERGAKKAIGVLEDPSRLDVFDLPPLGFTREFMEFKKPLREVFNMKPNSAVAAMIDQGYSEEDLTSEPVIIGTVHCSPADEPVLTMDGWVPIGDLDSNTHRVVSYQRTCNRLTRGKKLNKRKPHKKGGFLFTKDSRHYTGDMLTLKTAKSKTRVTPDHRVFVKFSDTFFHKYIVYLMRKGNWWRVGICTSGHRPYKAGGLGGRLATEQADAGWILGVFSTRQEALIEEARIQGLFGIPGLTFRTVSNNRLLTTRQLRSIHRQIQGKVAIRVKKLFRAFNLNEEWPLYTRGVLGGDLKKRNMRGVFLTIAANVLSGYMEIPVIAESFYNYERGIQKPELLPLRDVTREAYDGEVFSLDVQPYHYYISGGAVVHNSVKGGEADNVWIDTTSHSRMSSANVDDELRIAYVAVTRAKENVGLLQPMGLRNMIYFL